MKKVAFYVPCFNAQGTIRNCLDSIFKQTYPVEKVIVIDDCSTDDSLKELSNFSVEIIKHATNKGLASARNSALREILCDEDIDFVASVDADCQLESDWLMNAMNAFSSSKIAGVGGRLIEQKCSTLPDLWRAVHMKQSWGDEIDTPTFLFGSNTVYRKEVFNNLGLFDEQFRTNYEDVEFGEKVRKNGHYLVFQPKAVVHHLKTDSLNTIFNNYWNWNLPFYKKEGFYNSELRLIDKINENIGLANRYLMADLRSKEKQLVYLDFLLAIEHSLRDLKYFILSQQGLHIEPKEEKLRIWLSLIDLNLISSLNFKSNSTAHCSLVPKYNKFMQNCLMISIISFRKLKVFMKNDDLLSSSFRHLFAGIFKIDDQALVEKCVVLSESQVNWEELFNNHGNAEKKFVKELCLRLDKWFEELALNFPKLNQVMFKASQNITSQFLKQ